MADYPSWQDLLGANWQNYVNPRKYANSIVNSQFNPVINGLNMQHSRTAMLRSQTNDSIKKAYAPALAQYQAQTSQDAAAAANVQRSMQGLAGQLAGATGSSGNNAGLANTAGNYAGLVGAQGAVQGNLDRAGMTQAQQRVSQIQATRQSELANRMMDIDKALTDTHRAKADAYTKAFTEGLGMRNQLIGGALANRGSIINQDVLSTMAPIQADAAKLANKQAAQNMVWQNIQGNQSVEMNKLQMQALRQQMNQAGMNTRSFFNNDPGTQQQILDGFMGKFIDQNTGGWRKGFDANKVIDSMYKQIAGIYTGTAQKHGAKLRAAIKNWIYAQNGIQQGGFNPSDANGPSGDGGENSWQTTTDTGSGGAW